MKSRFGFAVLLVMPFLLVIETSAQAGPQSSALDRLSQVKLFAMGPVGFSGKTSQGETDYRVILNRPDALILLEKVYAQGAMEAKAYALTGIHQLSRTKFDELYAALPNSNDGLTTMRSCILSHETLRDIAKQLALSQNSGKYNDGP
jgi:hypothetical protein